MFSLFNFSSIFQGGSVDPIVRTPMTVAYMMSCVCLCVCLSVCLSQVEVYKNGR